MPLLISGKVLGVMGLGFETQKKFDGFTKEYLAKYAQLVAIALDNAQLYKSAELKIKEKEKVQQEYRNLFLEAQQGSQELLLLDEIQNTISGQLDLQSLYQLIIKKVSEIFDYSHANFGVFEGDFLTVKASYGYVDESFADKLPTSYKPVEYVLKHQQALLIPCKDSPLDLTENQKKLFKSVLLMPIILSDKVYGILTVASNTKTLSYKDVGLLKKVRELLVVAIENAQLHEQVKKELIRNESLFKISRSVQESNQLETLMDDIAEQIRRAVSARWSVIYKIDLSKAYIEHVSTTNHNNDSLPPFSFEQLQNGSTGFAIENKEVVLGQKDTDYGKTAATLQKRNNIGSFIVAPLIYRSKVIGILQVLNSLDDANFYQEDVALLTTVANQAGVALAQYDLRQKIEHQAYHDALTDLPNRLLFEDALTTTLADAKENNKMFAAMFLDLDGFKHVNDTLGHDVGDKLLQIVAKRLTSRTRQTDILARMGGDEFAIILNNLPSKDEAIRIGQSYLSLFQDVFKIDNHTVRVGTSIGISFYPDDASDAGSLLRHADSAMYQAKDSGKNSVCSFTPALAEKAKERVELEAELRKAVKEGGLELYYQPQLSCLTNECIGVEALLRWNHPELGFISPAKFIPIAEESKLILDIGTWVLHKACRQSVEWQNILAQTTSDKAIKMAVNISAIQFGSTDFIETIVSALNESSLDPELLEIEVTESVVMKDVSMIIDRLEALRSIGITVAIDDFGTGYSSLQYLQKLPLDKLKIDRSFINEITDGSSAPIASSILALAKSLNLKTVAEGIETEDQLEFLRMLGCDEAQGFYFAKPMPASKFWEWYTKTENSQLTKQVVSI